MYVVHFWIHLVVSLCCFSFARWKIDKSIKMSAIYARFDSAIFIQEMYWIAFGFKSVFIELKVDSKGK